MAKPTLMVSATVSSGGLYSPLQWTVRSDAGDYSM